MATNDYTAQDFLKELKTHDWTYNHANGDTFTRGQQNAQRLIRITSTNGELKALYQACRAFIFDGGEAPTLEPQPAVNKHDLKAIMLDAWKIARRGAERFGGTARMYLTIALKQAWAKVKAIAVSTYHFESPSILTICIDEVISRNTRLTNLPLIHQPFSDKREALAALNILRGAFAKPFIRTQLMQRA